MNNASLVAVVNAVVENDDSAYSSGIAFTVLVATTMTKAEFSHVWCVVDDCIHLDINHDDSDMLMMPNMI